jgi:hypothetical protein
MPIRRKDCRNEPDMNSTAAALARASQFCQGPHCRAVLRRSGTLRPRASDVLPSCAELQDNEKGPRRFPSHYLPVLLRGATVRTTSSRIISIANCAQCLLCLYVLTATAGARKECGTCRFRGPHGPFSASQDHAKSPLPSFTH